MSDINAIRLQYRACENVNKIRDEIQELKQFEEEMKQKEQKQTKNFLNSKIEPIVVPLRSSVDEYQKFSENYNESCKERMLINLDKNKNDETVLNEKRKIANEFKEQGTKFFKLKEFENACEMYSLAIENFSEDSVFYSNRSQCYIHLARYHDAIRDAQKAIDLDCKKTSKPFYRRTTAYEKLGENIKALQSSQEWILALPKDQVAKNTYDRIHNNIIEINKQKENEKVKWSRIKEKTSFIDTSANLRSNKPLKKILVTVKKSHSPIPDEVIDKLFNNNTGEHISEKKTDSKLFKTNFLEKSYVKSVMNKEKIIISKEKGRVNGTNEILKAYNNFNYDNNKINEKYFENKSLPTMKELQIIKHESCKDFSVPISGSQFYMKWKDLDEYLKFLYLLNISNEPSLSFGTLIGAQLDSNLLSEIIQIIHRYFVHFNIPYISFLYELSKNKELNILSLFLENDDKIKLNELLYVSSQENNINGSDQTNMLIHEIKKKFLL